jgi:hypothetical protein
MLTQHIALVTAAGGVNLSDLARASAALQKQVTNDLAPLWGITATVDGFPQLEDVPADYWPIIVGVPELGREAGIHLDENGQPYALVALSASWPFEASRACLDMLVNPFGDRTVTAASPRSDQGPVKVLVEVCGPCGDWANAYAVNGIFVADFCTPAYFGARLAARERLSFHGSLSAPFELLRGGRLAWHELTSNSWWLRSYHAEDPIDTELGALEHGLVSVRALARRSEPIGTRTPQLSQEPLETHARLLGEQESSASRARAHRLRALVSKRLVLGSGDRTPMLLTRSRSVDGQSGRVRLEASTHERLELSTEELESWVREELTRSAPGQIDTSADREHERVADDERSPAPRLSGHLEVDAEADARERRAPAPLAAHDNTHGAVAPTASTNEQPPPALSPYSSIAPVSGLMTESRASGSRAGWVLGGAALAGAVLFALAAAKSGVNGRTSVRQPNMGRNQTVLSEARSSSALVHAPPGNTEASRAESQELSASAPTIALGQGSTRADTGRRVRPRGQQSAANSNTTSAGHAAGRQPPASIEDLIETRR